jgi:signal peptidase II
MIGKPLLKYLVILLVMIGGCSADYQSKIWAKDHLKNKPAITIVKNFVDLGFTENRGMIFGILNGKMPRFGGIVTMVFRLAVLFVLMLFIWTSRRKPFLFLLPFLLFCVGALGNLIDPFIYGYVIDFIHIQAGNVLNWPFYFNLADAFITIGLFLLLMRSERFALSNRQHKAA